MVVLRVASWLAAVCATNGSFGCSLLTGVVLRELAGGCVVLSVRCMQLTSNQDGAVAWLTLVFPSCWAVTLRMIRMVMVMRTVGVAILTMMVLSLTCWTVIVEVTGMAMLTMRLLNYWTVWQLLNAIVTMMVLFLNCWTVIVKVTRRAILTIMLLNYWTVMVTATRMEMLMFLFLDWLLRSR